MEYHGNVYKYNKQYLFSIQAIGISLTAIFVVFSLLFACNYVIDKDYLYAAIIFLPPAFLTALTVLKIRSSHMEIKTTSEDISSHRNNKNVITIKWEEINTINRIRYFTGMEPITSNFLYTYFIHAGKKQIRFDENLQDIRNLLDEINVYIKKYNIETIAYDRGMDTLRKARTADMDENKRKEILNNGVMEKLTSL